MPMLRARLLGLFLALALIGLGTGIASAQVPYAPPTMSTVDDGLYRITLHVTAGADGAPSGFTVQWMKKSDYDANGGWPAAGDPHLLYCQFTGNPTLNLWAGPTFLLGAGQSIEVQPGDLFDETGIYTTYRDPLNAGTAYVLRGQTEGDGNGDPSAFTTTLTVTTLSGECTQGFWKNHGPAPCTSGNNADVWPASCFPMLLGTVSYTEAQICSILQTPANGNGLISLAHQLITAKLNICNGSDPTPISSTIADADALIDGQVVPPVGSGYLDPSVTSNDTEQLDDYNNGLKGGIAECPTGVRNTMTWGRVKVLYR